MPTSMTFNSLVQDLQDYLERGTPSDPIVFQKIPTLINLAERAIAQKLKIQGFLNNVISNLAAGAGVYPKPNRWRETVSMEFGIPIVVGRVTQTKRVILKARSYEYCRNYWPNEALIDVPKYYADYNYDYWLIVPTPNDAYPWQVNYYQLPPLLDATNQTNWLTNFAPNLLLYRALLEATPFLKNDERIPTWEGFYNEQLQDLDVQDLQKIADREAVRSKA